MTNMRYGSKAIWAVPIEARHFKKGLCLLTIEWLFLFADLFLRSRVHGRQQKEMVMTGSSMAARSILQMGISLSKFYIIPNIGFWLDL